LLASWLSLRERCTSWRLVGRVPTFHSQPTMILMNLPHDALYRVLCFLSVREIICLRLVRYCFIICLLPPFTRNMFLGVQRPSRLDIPPGCMARCLYICQASSPSRTSRLSFSRVLREHPRKEYSSGHQVVQASFNHNFQGYLV